MFPEMIAVYAPATFRRKDAKVFEIRGDEQIADADLTIDPNGLHTLRGRVLAAADHHAPTTIIRLKEAGTEEVPRLVEIEDDGTFQVNYRRPAATPFRSPPATFQIQRTPPRDRRNTKRSS